MILALEISNLAPLWQSDKYIQVHRNKLNYQKNKGARTARHLSQYKISSSLFNPVQFYISCLNWEKQQRSIIIQLIRWMKHSEIRKYNTKSLVRACLFLNLIRWKTSACILYRPWPYDNIAAAKNSAATSQPKPQNHAWCLYKSFLLLMLQLAGKWDK
jgi:hypothetical protein